MSCFCGHTHTSFAEALACSERLRGAGSPRPGNTSDRVIKAAEALIAEASQAEPVSA